MKKIGIIVAMDLELQMLLNRIGCKPEPANPAGVVIFSGKIDDDYVIICKSGIGKVNAAIATVTLITQYQPDYIINTGVAGSLDPNVVAMDIIIGSSVKYCDVWCGSGNVRGQVQGEPEWYPCIDVNIKSKGIDSLQYKYMTKKHICGVRRAPIVSGDWFMETVADKLKARRASGRAKAVDMESGAIAQVCHRFNMPFIPVRIISDVVGEPQHEKKYEGFWQDMASRSFDVLIELIKEINGQD